MHVVALCLSQMVDHTIPIGAGYNTKYAGLQGCQLHLSQMADHTIPIGAGCNTFFEPNFMLSQKCRVAGLPKIKEGGIGGYDTTEEDDGGPVLG